MSSRRDRSVLVTGFEPFGGEQVNASELAAMALAKQTLDGVHIACAILPCVFERSATELRAQLRANAPDLVVCVGQAESSQCIRLERFAINVDNADIPDNAGARPRDQVIAQEGPAAYRSTLPLGAMAKALSARDIKSEISHSAGTFVCNHVFYSLMQELDGRPSVRGGFIHVPLLPEQANSRAGHAQDSIKTLPSMPLETITRALQIAIESAMP